MDGLLIGGQRGDHKAKINALFYLFFNIQFIGNYKIKL